MNGVIQQMFQSAVRDHYDPGSEREQIVRILSGAGFKVEESRYTVICEGAFFLFDPEGALVGSGATERLQ